ncbi:MAG: hypothetical protein Q8P57_02490 [Candidatus Pacearchaeota archaeon]|nr:hypothetical protein [Candidatus Pacearchaeota archaeon]
MNKNKSALIIVLILISLTLIFLLMNYSIPKVDRVCTADAMICSDGSSVGRNPDNNCEFYECPSVGEEGEKIFCDEESRNAEICEQSYIPVCAWFDPEKIQCIKYPCAETVSNGCYACSNDNVLYYTKGECIAEDKIF